MKVSSSLSLQHWIRSATSFTAIGVGLVIFLTSPASARISRRSTAKVTEAPTLCGPEVTTFKSLDADRQKLIISAIARRCGARIEQDRRCWNEKFAEFVEKYKDQDLVPLEPKYIREGGGQWRDGRQNVVKYVRDMRERKKYEVFFNDEGRVVDIDGHPFTTVGSVSQDGVPHRAIWILDQDGRFLIKNDPRAGHFQHSSLADGEPVRAAGEIMIDEEGRVLWISNQSGRYHAKGRHLQQAVEEFNKKIEQATEQASREKSAPILGAVRRMNPKTADNLRAASNLIIDSKIAPLRKQLQNIQGEVDALEANGHLDLTSLQELKKKADTLRDSIHALEAEKSKAPMIETLIQAAERLDQRAGGQSFESLMQASRDLDTALAAEGRDPTYFKAFQRAGENKKQTMKINGGRKAGDPSKPWLVEVNFAPN